MLELVKKLVADESGATVIEYGLIAAFIGVAIIASLQIMGQSLVSVFAFINGAL